jgi:hypothetical protein
MDSVDAHTLSCGAETTPLNLRMMKLGVNAAAITSARMLARLRHASVRVSQNATAVSIQARRPRNRPSDLIACHDRTSNSSRERCG